MAVDIPLEILQVQQFSYDGVPWDLGGRNLVGSTHDNQEEPYVYYNMWLRYTVRVPRRCRALRCTAAYATAHNGPEYVAGQIYRLQLGSDALTPGVPSIPYVWDVVGKVSPELRMETELAPGDYWLFLTYNFAGQNNCYVDGVTAAFTGEAQGLARIVTGGAWADYEPYVVSADGSTWESAEAYVCDGGAWAPLQ